MYRCSSTRRAATSVEGTATTLRSMYGLSTPDAPPLQEARGGASPAPAAPTPQAMDTPEPPPLTPGPLQSAMVSSPLPVRTADSPALAALSSPVPDASAASADVAGLQQLLRAALSREEALTVCRAPPATRCIVLTRSADERGGRGCASTAAHPVLVLNLEIKSKAGFWICRKPSGCSTLIRVRQ